MSSVDMKFNKTKELSEVMELLDEQIEFMLQTTVESRTAYMYVRALEYNGHRNIRTLIKEVWFPEFETTQFLCVCRSLANKGYNVAPIVVDYFTNPNARNLKEEIDEMWKACCHKSNAVRAVV